MTRSPDPAAFRARTLARLRGEAPAEAVAVSEARKAINLRNTVRNAQRRKKLTPRQWKSALDRWGHKCVYCGRPVADKVANKDHFVPLHRGGTLEVHNVVPACPTCNRKKHDTEPLEYMVGIGRLVAYVEIANHLETLRK